MNKRGKLKIFLISLLVLLLIFAVFAAVVYFSGYEIFREIRYGENDANVIDIYIPKEAYERENNGCVLFIHGGSWSSGDKNDEDARCRLLASHGYISASLNYTLWSEDSADSYSVLQVLDEIDEALLKIKEFSSEREIDVGKIAITGYSAGAHLAMLYSYSRAESAPIDIAFTASMAGPADISPQVWGEDMSIRVIKRLTGEEISADSLRTGEADEIIASVSPTTFINELSPPTLLMHGGKDTVVPIANADTLVNRLSEHAVYHEYVYLPDSDHSLIHNPIGHLKYFVKLFEYCKKYF